MRISWGARESPARPEVEIIELSSDPEPTFATKAVGGNDGPPEAPVVRPRHDPIGSAGIWEAIANL